MAYLTPQETFVLLENSLDADGVSLLYRNPARVVACHDPAQLTDAMAEIEQAVADGYYAAGLISYEAGYVLEPKLAGLATETDAVPLLWFGLFKRRDKLTQRETEDFWRDQCRGRAGGLSSLRPAISEQTYFDHICHIHDQLAAGDVYQINYTFPLHGQASGDPADLHRQLRASQPVAYGAYIQTPDFVISSHSPELFVEKKGEAIRTRPMKGTLRRGVTRADDAAKSDYLRQDPKSRAENLMIVDLVRNDLSRLALPGSVSVDKLFEVEAYRSVLQMTSEVSASVAADITLSDVMRAIFPCGSVTGAPKIRAMEIIHALEGRARSVYTGGIGHLAPSGDMAFSVPIRTLVINKNGEVTLGVGGGIVADSDPQAEYDECLLKAAFLDPVIQPDQTPDLPRLPDRPCLIETIKWSRADGYWLLDGHMMRLAESAAYYNYPCDVQQVEDQLESHAEALSMRSGEDWRVRLLLSPTGSVSVTAVPINLPQDPSSEVVQTVALSKQRVQTGDDWLYHKTTRRQVLDQAHAREAVPAGHRDVILTNQRGELTEGTRYNLFLQFGEVMYTPPVRCGLLAGTCRQHLLQAGDSPVEERILMPRHLFAADKVYLANSLYGLVEVRPVR